MNVTSDQEGYNIKYLISDVGKASLRNNYDVISLKNELRLLTSNRWSEECVFFCNFRRDGVSSMSFICPFWRSNVASAYASFACENLDLGEQDFSSAHPRFRSIA